MVEAVAVEVEAQVGKRGKSRLGQSRQRISCVDMCCPCSVCVACLFNVFVMSNDKEKAAKERTTT